MRNLIPFPLRALGRGFTHLINSPRPLLVLLIITASLWGTNRSTAAFSCSPPTYQGWLNSCQGLQLRFLNGGPVSAIDHFELQYGTGGPVIATLPATATGFSDLRGCSFASHYTITQVGKDGSRCSTYTGGPGRVAPHSFPCGQCRTGIDPNASLVAVNAASFKAGVTPGSLVAIFGERLAFVRTAATSFPLPTSLAGTSVKIGGVAAPLLFVSYDQINAIVPPVLSSYGTLSVEVTNSDNQIISGTLNLQPTYPGLFSADASGTGVAAALVTSDGINFQRAWNQDGSPQPVSVGTAQRPAYLVLFGTGWRGISKVSVSIGGTEYPIAYAGPQGVFAGLDQINLRLPDALRGAGTVYIYVSTPDATSNPVRITIGN